VVLNVTATGGTKLGWLTVYPTGHSLPTASNLNFTAGQTVPNLVTVKIGTAGQVRIANTEHPTVPTPNAGSVHVIADVVGFYKTGVGDNLVAISPERVADTRNNTGGVGTSPLLPQEIQAINAAIASAVPDFPGYSAVVVNITATGAAQAGWLTAFPADAALPTASNVNFLAGQTVPNLAKLKVATTGDVGELNVANTAIPTSPQPSAGTVHLIVDIVAYFA
jgi:hypothetical protein